MWQADGEDLIGTQGGIVASGTVQYIKQTGTVGTYKALKALLDPRGT